jgi:Rod binding domain-containing protein
MSAMSVGALSSGSLVEALRAASGRGLRASQASLMAGSMVGPTVEPIVERQRSFSSALGQATDLRRGAESPREAAEQLVSVAFVQPLLKLMRESNRAAPPWAPTQGEKMFGNLADAELAQRLVRASRFPLVDRIERDLGARARDETAELPPMI